uniref:Uncharacterized protein n=1 Tax=Rhizophora mucronata TaxID=61149 RepID=A0A2P2JTR9_RHIMU
MREMSERKAEGVTESTSESMIVAYAFLTLMENLETGRSVGSRPPPSHLFRVLLLFFYFFFLCPVKLIVFFHVSTFYSPV